MSDSAPVQQEAAEPAPVQEPIQQEPEPQQQAPADPETEFDAAVEASAIDIPDGERLVPLSAVTKLREKLRTAKQQQAAPDPALAQELDDARARLRESEPLAQAFRAIQNAQPQKQQHQAPQQPVEDTARLEKIAKHFDFYGPDGAPDLQRARDHIALVREEATEIARAQTAPLIRHTLTGQAAHNVAKAKATIHPNAKQKADPAIIDRLVAQIANQEGGLATLANEEAVKQIWLNAWGLTSLQAQAQAAQEPAVVQSQATEKSAPVFTERSGGQVTGHQKTLSATEKKAAKEAGMTEKQYLDVAAGMKW